jgi:hypothetical protein
VPWKQGIHDEAGERGKWSHGINPLEAANESRKHEKRKHESAGWNGLDGSGPRTGLRMLTATSMAPFKASQKPIQLAHPLVRFRAFIFRVFVIVASDDLANVFR